MIVVSVVALAYGIDSIAGGGRRLEVRGGRKWVHAAVVCERQLFWWSAAQTMAMAMEDADDADTGADDTAVDALRTCTGRNRTAGVAGRQTGRVCV